MITEKEAKLQEFQKQGSGLQEHTLEDVFSNLDEDKMEEAKLVFIHAVEEGLLVKNCISEVHNKVAWLLVVIRTFSSDKGSDKVLANVPPGKRGRLFVKFLFSSKLLVEIGVNQFRNGNRQLYHKVA